MAKDIFHEAVRIALEKDGWKITDDPYSIRLLGVESDIDLGAERLMGAEREEAGEVEKIAVEPGRRTDQELHRKLVHERFPFGSWTVHELPNFTCPQGNRPDTVLSRVESSLRRRRCAGIPSA